MMAVVSSVVLVLLLLLGKGAAFLKPVPFPHPPRFASPPTRLFQSTISTLQSTSEELLSLLLDRRQSQAISTNKIDTLVEALITTPSTFDPKVSLNGPLWIVCHRVGPIPLWESLSGSIRVNIQGQQYVYSDNERSVINYSQIVGKGRFYVSLYFCAACATFSYCCCLIVQRSTYVHMELTSKRSRRTKATILRFPSLATKQPKQSCYPVPLTLPSLSIRRASSALANHLISPFLVLVFFVSCMRTRNYESL